MERQRDIDKKCIDSNTKGYSDKNMDRAYSEICARKICEVFQ